VIIDIWRDEVDPDDLDDRGSERVPLRIDIANGDLRALNLV